MKFYRDTEWQVNYRCAAGERQTRVGRAATQLASFAAAPEASDLLLNPISVPLF